METTIYLEVITVSEKGQGKKRGRKPKRDFMVYRSNVPPIICSSEEDAIDIVLRLSEAMKLPSGTFAIISGSGLKFHGLEKTYRINEVPFTRASEFDKPEETDTKTEPAPPEEPKTETNSEEVVTVESPSREAYAVRNTENPSLWMCKEGDWDSQKNRLFYDDKAAATLIAERVNGEVIPFDAE
jgi:hypothetical protein